MAVMNLLHNGKDGEEYMKPGIIEVEWLKDAEAESERSEVYGETEPKRKGIYGKAGSEWKGMNEKAGSEQERMNEKAGSERKGMYEKAELEREGIYEKAGFEQEVMNEKAESEQEVMNEKACSKQEVMNEKAESEQERMYEKAEPEQKAIQSGPEFVQVREGGRTYLLCACRGVGDDEEAMLADNRPEGLLPVAKKCVNGQMRLSYDITGKQSLSGCYEKKAIAYDELFTVLLSVHDCLSRMEEYLLSEDSLVFCPMWLYTSVNGRQLYFVYLPTPEGSFSEHIRELAYFLMEHVDYRDERAVALAGRFYQYAEAENFSMTVFLEENRAFFEEPADREEQDDRTIDACSEEWQEQEESGFLQAAKERKGRGKQMLLIALAAAVVTGSAAWSLPWNVQTLIPAGLCAGIAVGILFWYIGWANQMVIKKEREIFFIENHSSSGGVSSDGSASSAD